MREGYRQRGSDPDQLIGACIELDNAVIGRHPGVTFGLHICRGNNQIDVLRQRRLRADRAGFGKTAPSASCWSTTTSVRGFRAVAAVPEDRTVVLGLVTTRRRELESEDELQAPYRRSGQLVPLERLALSPQCGFASTWRATEFYRRAAGEAPRVAETARAVWGA